jgi:hypothetical protein
LFDAESGGYASRLRLKAIPIKPSKPEPSISSVDGSGVTVTSTVPALIELLPKSALHTGVTHWPPSWSNVPGIGEPVVNV